MKNVRLGIIGLGLMGQGHARSLIERRVPRMRLTAIADTDPARHQLFPGVAAHTDASKLIRSGEVDAVLIATPHFSHSGIAHAALRAGLHVLVEKPLTAQASTARRLAAAAARRPDQMSAVMLNQRTDPFYRRIRALLHSGRLGAVRRVQWTITNWFRSAAYYDSNSWRATWSGEGGGVLLNQCLHNLDLFQWLFGQPTHVRAHCNFGRYHDIEVEDDVTAYLEYPDGAHATFITSTGEAPGVNRLEITTEGGLIIYENDTLLLRRNAVPMSEFSRNTAGLFSAPRVTDRTWRNLGHGLQHVGILRNFTAAILDDAPLLAPLADGVASVELVNAMLLSAWTGERVTLPLDARRHDRLLGEKIAGSLLKP
ncbi:MAG: Gfo/Idh/MocA family oxidoreductase [Candidatus Didemnitutus sp.]|nr:Gfo/Idh/MocA family oxidoreductase [Candidatus Didemnitutus sp.]